MKIEKLKKVENSEEIGLEVQVSTVPPKNNGVQKSSRRNRHEKTRNGGEAWKGVEPIGKNGELWEAKLNLKRIFKEKETIVWSSTDNSCSY